MQYTSYIKQQNTDTRFIYQMLMCAVLAPFLLYWVGIHEEPSSPLGVVIATVLVLMIFLRKITSGIHKLDILAIFINLLMLAVNLFTYTGGIGCVLAYFNVFILLIILNNVRLEHHYVQRIRVLAVIMLLTYLLSFSVRGSGEHISFINFRGFSLNPNMIGVLTLAMYFNFYALVHSSYIQKWMKVFLFLLATAVAVYYIQLSMCRSAYLAMLIFLFLHILSKWKMKNYKKVLRTVAIVAFLFPFIYLLLVENLGDITFLGKTLNSREGVWRGALDLIWKHPFLGTGADELIVSTTGIQETPSAHNTFLGYWKTLGIVPLFTVLVYLTRGRNATQVTPKNFAAKKMFISCMAICAVETLLNESGTYLFFLLLLLTIDEKVEAKE